MFYVEIIVMQFVEVWVVLDIGGYVEVFVQQFGGGNGFVQDGV